MSDGRTDVSQFVSCSYLLLGFRTSENKLFYWISCERSTKSCWQRCEKAIFDDALGSDHVITFVIKRHTSSIDPLIY
jgi:hypothetical protein